MTLHDAIDQLTDHLIARTETQLRDGQGVIPPTVWAFDPHLDPPLLGSATTRPFYQGRDAHQAIERLGVFPAVVRARLVAISWEQADLFSGLGLDDRRTPTGLVTVLVDNTGHHQVTVRPCLFHPRGVRWYPAEDLRDIELPLPIQALADRWLRHPEPDDPDQAVAELVTLDHAGYRVELAPRSATTYPV